MSAQRSKKCSAETHVHCAIGPDLSDGVYRLTQRNADASILEAQVTFELNVGDSGCSANYVGRLDKL